MNRDIEEQRQELWINAWVACCSASNCTRKDIPTTWADTALEDFDERFYNQSEKV
jgi:hypothetical protein